MAVTPLSFNGVVFLDNLPKITTGLSTNTFVGDSVSTTESYIFIGRRGYERFVESFKRGEDGSVIEYITGNAWAESPNNKLREITPNSTKNTGGFAFYTAKDGVTQYLVGWAIQNNRIYRYDITGRYPPLENRLTEYVAPKACGNWGRAGWDGDHTVYFYNSNDDMIYSWDTNNPTTPMQERVILKIPREVTVVMQRSWVGTGMLVKNDVLYMPASSNPDKVDKEALFAFDFKTGDYLGSLLGTDLKNNGFDVHDKDAGCIQLSPTSTVAYLLSATSAGLCQYKTIFLDTLGNATVSNNIHWQDVSATLELKKDVNAGEMGEQARYRVLVNGVKVFPLDSDFTDIQPLPYTAAVTGIANSYFTKVGDNDLVFEVDNGQEIIIAKKLIVKVINTDPIIESAAISPETTHDSATWVAVKATTEIGDLMSYQISINNSITTPWTDPIYPTPLEINYRVRPSDLIIGVNKIKVEIRDNFKNNLTVVTKELIITKNNQLPVAELELKGRTIYIKGTDPDNDPVKFNITVNGTQILPTSGFSPLYDVPFQTSVDIPRHLVDMNRNNTILLKIQDSAGDTVQKEETKVIGMAGLMFSDEAGSFYTTDTGELLKYLDVGTIMSGGATQTFKVWLRNTSGYVMKVPVLSTQFESGQDSDMKVWYAHDTNPINFAESIQFADMQPGEFKIFLFKIECGDNVAGERIFKIRARASIEPIQEGR